MEILKEFGGSRKFRSPTWDVIFCDTKTYIFGVALYPSQYRRVSSQVDRGGVGSLFGSKPFGALIAGGRSLDWH